MAKLPMQFGTPVTVVGGAAIPGASLARARKIAPDLVAADGGANLLHAQGLKPTAVIGDMDSISDAAAQAFDGLCHRVAEQDTTDFEKVIARIRCPLVLALGFLGGRLDHQMAALNVLGRYSDRAIILFGEDEIVFLAPGALRLSVTPGDRVAVLPLGHSQVTTSGLTWDMVGQDLHPTGLVSSSNQAAEAEITIAATGPVLITLPMTALDAATAAVLGG